MLHLRVKGVKEKALILSRSLWDPLTKFDQLYSLSNRENMSLVFK